MTVEEKAKKYADDVAFLVPYDGTMNFYDEKRLKTAKIDYLAGHKEATRWRDPKEELPEIGKPIIVKYRTAKNVEKYGIGKYFNLGIGNPWTIAGSTSREVIGWRPIE